MGIYPGLRIERRGLSIMIIIDNAKVTRRYQDKPALSGRRWILGIVIQPRITIKGQNNLAIMNRV
jgi:hypothetical protein